MPATSLNSRATIDDVRGPICYPDGREFRVCELRARDVGIFANVFIVEMDLCEVTRGDCYSVWVTLNWETRYLTEIPPSECALFTVARQQVYEHFATHRYSPRLSRHPFPIRLEF